MYGGNENRWGGATSALMGLRRWYPRYTTRKYMVEGAEWPYDRHPEVLRYPRP